MEKFESKIEEIVNLLKKFQEELKNYSIELKGYELDGEYKLVEEMVSYYCVPKHDIKNQKLLYIPGRYPIITEMKNQKDNPLSNEMWRNHPETRELVKACLAYSTNIFNYLGEQT